MSKRTHAQLLQLWDACNSRARQYDLHLRSREGFEVFHKSKPETSIFFSEDLGSIHTYLLGYANGVQKERSRQKAKTLDFKVRELGGDGYMWDQIANGEKHRYCIYPGSGNYILEIDGERTNTPYPTCAAAEDAAEEHENKVGCLSGTDPE